MRPGGPARVRAACVLSAEPLSVLVESVSYHALTVSQRHVGPLSGLTEASVSHKPVGGLVWRTGSADEPAVGNSALNEWWRRKSVTTPRLPVAVRPWRLLSVELRLFLRDGVAFARR